MKNTIRIKTVGSHSIIERFDELPIDPAMTELRNRKAVAELPEQLEVNKRVADKNRHTKKATAAAGKIRVAHKYIKDAETLLVLAEGDQDAVGIINANIERANGVIAVETKAHESFDTASKGCDCDIDELGRICDHKRREFKKANPIYSHPRKNEVVIDEAKFNELSALFGNENEKVAVVLETFEAVVVAAVGDQAEVKAPFQRLASHEVVADFRGSQWFNKVDDKWLQSEVVTDLGVTKSDSLSNELEADAIEAKDLTDEQREEIRVQGLTVEQNEAEKALAIDSAVTQAAVMKTKMEIQGATAAKALTDSKAWYQIQVDLIGVKYA